jgi:tetratricopeptide (TPR) repeat protein
MQRLRCLLVIVLLSFAVSCTRDPIKQSDNLVASGNKFFNRGKFREASLMYRRALQKNQKNGEAYYRLGLSELKLMRFGDAAGAFRRALDIQPNNGDAATKLADIYWVGYIYDPKHTKSTLGEVQELSDALLKRDPKSYDGLRLAGYVALANNDREKALKNFEAAHQVDPSHPDLSLLLSQTLVAAGRAPEAEAMAKGALEKQKTYAPLYDQLIALYMSQNRFPEAEAMLKTKVANNPKQENYRVQLALFYYGTKHPQEMENQIQQILSNPKDFPLGHLTAGRFYMRIHDLDRARREFEEGVRTNSKDKAAYQKEIVRLLAAQTKYGEASQIVNEVLKDNPKDDQAIALHSALQLESGDSNQIQTAINNLQSLVAKEPKNADLRYQLGRALLLKNQPSQARVQLEEAVQLWPDLLPPRLLLAQIYTGQRDYNRALQMADAVLQRDPNNLPARLTRTGALFSLGERDRAKQELQAVLKASPTSVDARYQLAAIDFTEKRYKQAEDTFQQLRRDFPNDKRGVFGLTETYIAQNDFKDALQIVNDEIKKDPSRNDLRLALANILVRSQQYDQAIGQYQELSAKSPKDASLLLHIAEAYRLKGDTNAAIDNFKKASTLAPNDVTALVRLGMLLDGLGRKDEAKPYYERALRVEPDNGVALNNLAYIKAEEGSDLDQALAYAQRAKQRYPQEPNISDTLGWIYIKKNLADDAIRVYRDLLAKYPDNPTFRYHLAMALFQRGDRVTAKREGEQALQGSQSKEEQAKIRDLLTKIG